jgi:hypothetical protein
MLKKLFQFIFLVSIAFIPQLAKADTKVIPITNQGFSDIERIKGENQ